MSSNTGPNYEGIAAHIVAAIREKDATIERLERELAAEQSERGGEIAELRHALECLLVGACAVGVPNPHERAVLQDAVKIARAALAKTKTPPTRVCSRCGKVEPEDCYENNCTFDYSKPHSGSTQPNVIRKPEVTYGTEPHRGGTPK